MRVRCLSTALLAVSLAAAPSAVSAQIVLQPVVSGLEAPVGFIQVPWVPEAQVIPEHGGRIRLLVNGELQPDDFLDLSGVVRMDGELGLLGVVFPVDYGRSHRVFVSFSDQNGNTVVARFAGGDLLHPDPGTRFDLVWPGGTPYIPQPSAIHKGGGMSFGPDGYLYIALGDGGPGDDPDHRAQDPLSLLGKMLRIDVSVGGDHPTGYDVPADNPFAGRDDVLGEIWAFGFRNPWRWSFDDPWAGGTGALIVADVGQDSWEEINYEPAGAGGRNYGWRNREGAHDHLTDLPPYGWNLTDPMFEYSHEMGRSVIGGSVYRGSLLGPDYVGKYFFADYMSGGLWALDLQVDPFTGEAVATGLTEFSGLGYGAVRPSSFGMDGANELYLVSYAYGTVSRLIRGAPGSGLGSQCGLNGDPCPNTKTSPANGEVEPSTSATLTWSAASGAIAYEYCIELTNDGQCDLWTAVGNTLAATVTRLAAGTTYYWQVRATGSSGSTAYADGASSAFWNFTTAEAEGGSSPPTANHDADYDADGKSDILWAHTDGRVAVWLMNGASVTGGGGILGAGTGWSPVRLADLNGDGRSDVVWQHTDGRTFAWFMNGATVIGGANLVGPDTGWSVRQIGDFNNDGKQDILWTNTDGSVAVWLMDGPDVIGSSGLLAAGGGWDAVQLGDFNGDGKSDIVWQHADGATFVWLMDGVNVIGGGSLVDAGTGWIVRLIGDLDGDGKSDILWQHTDGRVSLWLMSGANVTGGGGLLGAGTGWTPVRLADLNGDGRSDILWQHADGRVFGWLMNGASVVNAASFFGPGTGWTISQTGDYNSDGKQDILWRNTDGSVVMWLMNGLSHVGGGGLLGAGPGWSPVP